jgi:predicted RecA/RadA family phage recombinase
MAQTPAIYRHPGDALDFTAGNNGATAGDVSVVAGVPLIAPRTMAASEQDSLMSRGVWDMPKKTGQVFTARKPVFWDATGTPRVGDNNSGAADNANGNYVGMVVEDAGNNAATVRVKQDVRPLTIPQAEAVAVTAAGNAANNSTVLKSGTISVITTDNNDKGVTLPAPIPGSSVVIINRNSALTVKVWPPVGATLKLNGDNTNAQTLAVNTARTVYAVSATDWIT